MSALYCLRRVAKFLLKQTFITYFLKAWLNLITKNGLMGCPKTCVVGVFSKKISQIPQILTRYTSYRERN